MLINTIKEASYHHRWNQIQSNTARLYTESETLEFSFWNEYLQQTTPFKGSENSGEGETERVKQPETTEDTEVTKPSKSTKSRFIGIPSYWGNIDRVWKDLDHIKHSTETRNLTQVPIPYPGPLQLRMVC